jgi:site-specific DNA recombinase
LPELLPDTAIKIAVPAIIDDSVWNTVQDRRKTNKHLQPVRKEKYLLQGLITCGQCGHTFQITLIHGRRSYGCRGRLKYTHLDDSPRCTVQNIDAVWIEEQVWQRIEVIINDPNKLKKLIEDTIANLKNRETELSARIKPIDERLAVIADQKARLAEEWFQINLNPDKWNELKRNLEQEETRLKSVRGEIDPAQIEELENTRNTLQYWMAERDNIVKWNLENEDYSKFRTVSWPHDDVLALVNSENKETAKEKQFPGTRRDLLDFLQVRLMVFTDRIEIKAIFPIEPIKNQLFAPDCMSARCRQSL